MPGAPFTSLLSVVNSTASAKAVKVRFLEGKNSREVLDFNLYLSRRTCGLPRSSRPPTGAALYMPDLSCTTPGNPGAAATAFVNYAYTGSAADGADTSLDRTREGYVEIIEMGDVSSIASTTFDDGHPLLAFRPSRRPTTSRTLRPTRVAGSGGLFGSMTLINVLAR